MTDPIIEADQLSVTIDGARILDSLSFRVEAGALTGIIGPNGSGKTTLLRAISGIQKFEGRLLFGGIPIDGWEKKELARRVAVLPQDPFIAFDFEVRDYVTLGRMPHKGWLERDTATDRDKVDAVLDELDLNGLSDRTIPSLSGGERQRVLLAQALVQDTSLLLLDEPTAHLDVYHQFDLLKRIRRLADAGKTVLIVFHDLALAVRFTDALLVLHEGRLVGQGRTLEVLDAALIRDVFRMSATLQASSNDHPTIHYLDQA